MEKNTTTTAMTHVIRDRFACPQNADLRVRLGDFRVMAGAESGFQGRGVSAFGISVKGRLLLDGVVAARTQARLVPITFVVTAVAFPAYGRPPV